MEQLVQFDAAVRLLDGDDSVGQLYQIIVLHIEKLVADLFRLRFGRECDYDEVGHLKPPMRC